MCYVLYHYNTHYTIGPSCYHWYISCDKCLQMFTIMLLNFLSTEGSNNITKIINHQLENENIYLLTSGNGHTIYTAFISNVITQ